MRKLILSVFILSLFSISGCESTPSSWAGIDYEERQSWMGIGIEGTEAKFFRTNGFTPIDVKEWLQLGINSPNTIVTWHRAGFTAKQTSKWINKGMTLKEAIDLTR